MTKNLSVGGEGLKIFLDHKNSMVHHPCSIFFQNDQYLSSFQVILSPKSKRNDKKF